MKSEFCEVMFFMQDVVLIILIVVLIISMLFFTVLNLKNANTAKNQMRILNAITDYQNDCIKKDMYKEALNVSIQDKEDYDKTLWRLWDWGYTRILPKDKFEIIKPYIK